MKNNKTTKTRSTGSAIGTTATAHSTNNDDVKVYKLNIHTECQSCMGRSCCSVINKFETNRADNMLDDIVFKVSCSYHYPNQNTICATGYSRPMNFQENFDQCNECCFKDVCKYDTDKLMKEVNCTLHGLNYIKYGKIIVKAACNGYFNNIAEEAIKCNINGASNTAISECTKATIDAKDTINKPKFCLGSIGVGKDRPRQLFKGSEFPVDK